jgi:hypothetical protein
MKFNYPHTAAFAGLLHEMMECDQTEGLTILEHGLSVARWFEDLHAHLTTGTPLKLAWRLPDWIGDDRLVEHCLPLEDLLTYQVFHDCGKPRCITFDAQGRRHFPNHAALSEQVWLEAGGDAAIGRLIGMDMDIHLLKSEDLDEFAARPEALSLLLTGLAEIHANAAMFGGFGSDSFKIKWKHLNKRGRQILARIPFTTAAKIAA